MIFSVSSSWSQPETGGKQPTARHGHVIIAVGSRLYIHGGMAGDKFYSDMFSLDTSKAQTVVAIGPFDSRKNIGVAHNIHYGSV